MNNITFVIFTFNEEARIENVIKNFKDFGKILIADNKSTDNTVAIAKSYGCDVYTREKHYVFVENQELVDLLYPKITTDWIYWGFADEMLEKKALLKIAEIIKEDRFDIINIDRKNYFYGDFCYDLYNSRTNKIFKKGSVDFTDNVIHGFGKPVVDNKKILIVDDEFFVHHFISNTASSYLNVINRYTDCEVNFSTQKNTSILYLILFFLKNVFTNYFFKKGYKAGFSGLVLLELMLFYTLVKNMKVYEYRNGLNPITIEKNNNDKRNSILSGLNE